MAATGDQLSAGKYGPRLSPFTRHRWPPQATNPPQLDRDTAEPNFLRPFLGWCLKGWVETPVASSQPERREHGRRGVCRWMDRILVFSNETVFFAPPSSICYHLLPSAAVEPFLARRLLLPFAMRAWQPAAVTRCLAGEGEMRRGGGAKAAKGGRKGRWLGGGGSALRGAKQRSRSKAPGWRTSRKRAWKRQMPGGFPLGIACQLLGRKIRSGSQGSPRVTLLEMSLEIRAVFYSEKPLWILRLRRFGSN
jgi:hypothetical protein